MDTADKLKEAKCLLIYTNSVKDLDLGPQLGHIHEKKPLINKRYERAAALVWHHMARLDEANTLHQFFR